MTSSSTSRVAVAVRRVSYAYGEARALQDVSFAVQEGAIFGLLGPNGGGKSTLFRLLSTLTALQEGEVEVLGLGLRRQRPQVRPLLGVVFQSPALDGKLSVEENLKHQGHLYGLRGDRLRQRMDRALQRFGLSERRRQRTEHLSGGLQRRVELAKALLHEPRLLILDEPSTGLDPGARHDLWTSLEEVRQQDGVTVLMTTHLLEEAEGCDHVAILDEGQLVVHGVPAELEAELGGDVLSIRARRPQELARTLADDLQLQPRLVGGRLRVQHDNAAAVLQEVVDRYGTQVDAVTLARPTLEDVFIHYTGREFHETQDAVAARAADDPTPDEAPVTHETAGP